MTGSIGKICTHNVFYKKINNMARFLKSRHVWQLFRYGKPTKVKLKFMLSEQPVSYPARDCILVTFSQDRSVVLLAHYSANSNHHTFLLLTPHLHSRWEHQTFILVFHSKTNCKDNKIIYAYKCKHFVTLKNIGFTHNSGTWILRESSCWSGDGLRLLIYMHSII